ncbi:Mu transposase C-terminal domain-containing protein [Sphingomonas sp. KC8]|uniref:Mu transposase C-terminal domain-containing protein n=1 Tax=Sphingomonas sp. KC8 TaxID=1030157 RepID=UPI000A31D36C|nr:Mu transposase C-terminal domain-containing protein [Sphingomonas sp. KC8]ARS28278.1 transposase [Sphingomonas sp. KC8]
MKSTEALSSGAELYPIFRKHVPLEGPLAKSTVAAIIAATGLGERQVRRLAVRFKANPIAESLAPAVRGPKVGSHRISTDVKAAIDRLIVDLFLTKPAPTAALAASEISGLLMAEDGEFRFAPEDIPSERTLVRLIGEISAPQRARSSMGSKQRSAYEPHPGAYRSDGLLDLVQMDHTRADVILVDSIHREELGRPWVTLIIDVWTRVILGFYVSFGDPSIFRCGRAVANALLPKEPLLARLGIDVEYPMFGQFARLHADHAAPHRAESFRRACLAHGIDPDIRPRGPAHFGGHIERLIGTMIGKMRLLPGATGSNVTQRDGYDAGKAAALTIAEFERWLVCQIGIYHNTPHAGLGGQCPAQVWARETAGKTPLLPVSLDTERLTRQFLPSTDLTVHSYGVQIRHRRYWHPELAVRIGQKITVHHDERTLQEVYAHCDGVFLPLSVVGRYPDITEPEWEAERKRIRLVGAAYQADGAKAATARYIQAARREVITAVDRTSKARLARKRQEREGVSHADTLPAQPAVERTQWQSVAELPEDNWLQWRN